MHNHPYTRFIDLLIDTATFRPWAIVLLQELSGHLATLAENVYAIGHDDNDGDSSQQLVVSLLPTSIELRANSVSGLRYRSAFGSQRYYWIHKALIFLAFAINEQADSQVVVDEAESKVWERQIRKQIGRLGVRDYIKTLLLTPCAWPQLLDRHTEACLNLQSVHEDEIANLSVVFIRNGDAWVVALGRLGKTVRDGLGGYLPRDSPHLLLGAVALLIEAIAINSNGQHEVIPRLRDPDEDLYEC